MPPVLMLAVWLVLRPPLIVVVSMRLSDLHYELPPERIAQHPVEPRDAARLLVLDRRSGTLAHRTFRDLGEYLSAGDCLVLNDTRVLPARFFARRQSGGRVEGLFLRQETAAASTCVDGFQPTSPRGAEGLWRTLLRPSARLRVGETLLCEGDDARLEIIERLERGEWLVRPIPDASPVDLLTRIGRTPLPPYIERPEGKVTPHDEQRYQTVYARSAGAVAAPTAGLHFTPELLARLGAAGVNRATVTLHVGVGTFLPIEVERLAEHRMHAEWNEVGGPALATLSATRDAERRIVAIGTTSARALESLAITLPTASHEVAGGVGWTDIFIYPPYRFRNVDVLVTNFHLPGSTLLALVMAFAGIDAIREAYRVAIEQEYRFYSYGDAMLIL